MFTYNSLIVISIVATALSQHQDGEDNTFKETSSANTMPRWNSELGNTKPPDVRRRVLKRLQFRSKLNSTLNNPLIRVRVRPHGSSTDQPLPFGAKQLVTPPPAATTPAPLVMEDQPFTFIPPLYRRYEPGSFFPPRPMLEDYEDYELMALTHQHHQHPPFHSILYHRPQHLAPPPPLMQQHSQRRAHENQSSRRLSTEQMALNSPNFVPLTPASVHNGHGHPLRPPGHDDRQHQLWPTNIDRFGTEPGRPCYSFHY